MGLQVVKNKDPNSNLQVVVQEHGSRHGKVITMTAMIIIVITLINVEY